MIREIKFRAWHKATELMDEVVTIDLYDEEIGVLYANPITQGEDIQRFDFDEIELMESTGLKDKNGIEIYEGDIVCDQYANNYTPIFRNGTYMAYNVDYLHLTKQEPSTQFNVVWKNGCEVIGNIYENPELLKER